MRTTINTIINGWASLCVLGAIVLWYGIRTAITIPNEDLREANGDTEPLPQEAAK